MFLYVVKFCTGRPTLLARDLDKGNSRWAARLCGLCWCLQLKGKYPSATCIYEQSAPNHGPEPIAAVAYIGRNGKYLSSWAKSPLHTLQGGGARTCVRFKRAMATPAEGLLNFIIGAGAGAGGSRCLWWRHVRQPAPAFVVPRRRRSQIGVAYLLCNKKIFIISTNKPTCFETHRKSLRCNFRFFPFGLAKLQRKINMLKPDPT